MEDKGNNIDSLLEREVFYLVRGRNKGNIKVLLVHGSFFETIKIKDLISQSFLQVLEERLNQSNKKINNKSKNLLISMFSEQENFSKVRNVEKASVKLRFRIMTEVKAEGNILNTEKYPDIADNTINFVIPYNNKKDEERATKRMIKVFGKEVINSFKIFKLKHHFNGYYLVFQKKI